MGILRSGAEKRPLGYGRRLLTTLIALAAILVLGRFLLLTLVGVVAQSERWNLPSGALLETILSSCQTEHTQRSGVDGEHLICPTRIADHRFPATLRDAVVASEDARFFSHGALDLRSTIRATWHFLNGKREGGSTITQQLARSLLLRNEYSLRRKLLEAVLAVRIFSLLTPQEILARYLNAVPHARNMSGFDEPARHYFGVGVEDLNLAETAILVGMLPEPNARDPLRHPAGALKGARIVLKRMLARGKIGAEDAAIAEEEVTRRLRSRRLRRGEESYARIEYRPYRDLALREARAGGIALTGNYRLIVHADAGLQQHLNSQLCSISGRHKAAGVFMRPTGEVLAVAGSCAYTGEWNRAADIARSIGSTGKLFPLIGVEEASFSLKNRLSTAPLRYPNWPSEPNPRCRARPMVSLDYALTHSCNRPWTEASMRLGRRVTEIVRRFGLVPPSAPSLVPIGGVQTSPLKVAQAYASLPNKGRLPQIRFLSAAIGPEGEIIGRPTIEPGRRVMSVETAGAVLQGLRGPVRRGTAKNANSEHALVYGKTGTSSRNVDAWFVGVTRDFVGSIWVGHDAPRPMPGMHGGGGPAKAFSHLTNYYYLRLAQTRFAHAQDVPRAEWWSDFKRAALREPMFAMAASFAMLMTCLLLLASVHGRRETESVLAPMPQTKPAPSPAREAAWPVPLELSRKDEVLSPRPQAPSVSPSPVIFVPPQTPLLLTYQPVQRSEDPQSAA